MTTYHVVVTGAAGSGRQRFVDAVADVVVDDSGYLTLSGDLNLQLTVTDLGAQPDRGVVLGTVLLVPDSAPPPLPPLREPVVAVAGGAGPKAEIRSAVPGADVPGADVPTAGVPGAEVTLREPSLDRAAATRILLTLLDRAIARCGTSDRPESAVS